jgi:GNAT superfamily N-acetyltransferase
MSSQEARPEELVIRTGESGDVPIVLGLLDEALRWLVSRGQTGQWGTTPFSIKPRYIEAVERWAAAGYLRIAETAGHTPLGALALGEKPKHVPPADRLELYLLLLVTSRAHQHRGIGAALVNRARSEAFAAGVPLLRVDCWAGSPRLVGWYEEQGFDRLDTFTVKVTLDGKQGEIDWIGQLLQMEIARAD